MFKYFIIILISFFLPFNKLLAQADDFGIGDVDTALGGMDLKQIIANIINIFLGFLGIIAVILILYGGFLWMTSKGNAEQVQEAKQLIISAIIGLVIILSSYAIASFVISSLGEATGVSESEDEYEGASSDDDSSGDSGCPEPLDQNEVKICSISPESGSIGSYVTIRGWNFGETEDSVTFDDNAGNISNADLVSCNGDAIWTETKIKIVVPDLTVNNSYSVYVSVGDNNDYTSFVVSEGEAGPNISCLTPDFGPSGIGVVISGIGFGGTGGSVIMNGWEDSSESEINVNTNSWSENEININIPSSALSSDIIINTTEDLSSSGEYFKVSCETGEQCSSGCCDNNSCSSMDICMANDPDGIYISSIYPTDGASGTLVTIFGSGFGDVPGNVIFYDDVVGEPASFPSSVNSDCSNYWTNNSIIVVAPDDLNDGLLDIIVNIEDEESNSGNFEQNEIVRPGICGLSNESGIFEDTITFYGVNFNMGDEALFGGEDWVQNINYSDAQTISANVPNMSSQDLDLYILSDEINSNPFPFTISSTDSGIPFIISINPTDSANKLEYITISGGNFGSQMGSVVLINSNGDEILSNIDLFPSQCSANIWQDDQIIAIFSDIGEKIKVVRNDEVESPEEEYQITSNTSGPSIACIVPDNGPVNSFVNIYGMSFEESGNIIFTDNKQANLEEAIINTQQILNVSIPAGAETGEIYYSKGTDSNSILFEVGSCSLDSDCDNELCCPGDFGDYCAATCETGPNYCEASWTITTLAEEFALLESYECSNNLQSPSPWPHGLNGNSSLDAYIDSNIIIRFTREINVLDDLLAANLQLYECSSEGVGCDTLIIGQYMTVNNDSGVSFNPDNNLNASSWYKVALGEFNSALGNDVLDLAGFTWNFKTQENLCEMDSISLNPNESPNKDIYLGNTKSFTAVPQAENCNVCGSEYDWSWDLDDNNCETGECASIVAIANNPNNISWIKLEGEHISDPSSITLTVDIDDNYSSISRPIILPPDLELLDYGPQCDDSCNNPEVWAQFNTDLKEPSTDLELYSCDSIDNCQNTNLAGEWDIVQGNIIKIINLTIPNSLYKVVIPAEIENEFGYTLGYEHIWYFNVGNENCEFASIEVLPDDYISGEIGEIIEYEAELYSDPGICNGQLLNCEDCTWSWNITDGPVATIDDSVTNQSMVTTLAGGGPIDIMSNLDGYDLDEALGHLTVVLEEGEEPNYQAPGILDSNPNGNGICLNAAISATFSEVMNKQSIRDNMHVYQENDTDGYIEISGSFSFSEDNYDVDEDSETRVIFNPGEELIPFHPYWVLIGENVKSINTLTLSFAPHDVSGITQGHLWTFSTGETICQISYVIIDPEEYKFTTPNTYQSFSAQAYDPSSTLLSVDSYQWSLVDSSLFSLTDSNDSTANLSSLNDNGETYLNVQASDSNPDVGQGNSSARVEAFLCENPWPSSNGTFNAFNDNDYGTNDYNFSTYYCQNEGITGSQLLPYLPDTPGDFILSEGGDILKEYVFVINPIMTMINNNFVFDNRTEEKKSWWQRIFNWSTAKASGTIYNFMITENTVEQITLQWQDEAIDSANMFTLQRKTADSEWETYYLYTENELGNNTFSYIDWAVIEGVSYEYRLGVDGDYTDPITVTVGEDDTSFDIIAIRVMANMDHLSPLDWFKQYAPNSNAGGQLIEVAGYEAFRVGNTIYVAGTNFGSSDLYTNIYALSYNISARSSTINIYNQLLDNLKLNTNLDIGDDTNSCFVNNTIACSNDYDCGPGDYCLSLGAKLHRDTKRLSDLINIKNSLNSYGNDNKFCSINLAPCFNDDDCLGPTNFCQKHYPSLESGTFVNGLSTSKWNSWDQEFGNIMGEILPIDPVNKFNGCPEGVDSDTCWSEEIQEFTCPIDSLVYLYQENNGISYNIGANFEFDSATSEGITFTNHLKGSNHAQGAINIDNIIDLYDLCNAETYNASGLPGGQICGDGIVDPDTEQCDGNPANICPEANWEEYIVGCYPPGSLDNYGNLIECTWYINPDNYSCGGYCGDGQIYQTDYALYELCEVGVMPSEYNCMDDNYSYYEPTCEACSPVCDDGSGAGNCGDGSWDSNNEQCDASATPDGLSNWDCTEGDYVSCNTCVVNCSGSGIPYLGQCGNSIPEGPESCDFAGVLSTALANNENTQYQCTNICTDYGGWCGNNNSNPEGPEECEYNNYEAPPPIASNINHTYQCSGVCYYEGGYCGDGGSPNTDFGEECDTASYSYPTPSESSAQLQYDCTNNCKIDGGFCGNGIPNESIEECDPTDYIAPDPQYSNINEQYQCTNICTDTGGYCGDGNSDTTYNEQCDPNGYDIPAPNESSQSVQYQCTNICTDTGGWCGDGDHDIAYNEQCDPYGYDIPAPNESSSGVQYSCSSICADTGGWCGNNNLSGETSYEQCEGSLHTQPTPAQSSSDWHYECNASTCHYQGGYCGNGTPSNANIESGYGEECDFNSYNPPNAQNSSEVNQYNCNFSCEIDGGWCGDGQKNIGFEECEGGMSCNQYDPTYLAGQITCGTPGAANACTVVDTASCCTNNTLRAKFLVDNTFTLWVNGVEVGTGGHWGGCDGGGAGDACEFLIDNVATGFSFDNNENVLSFKAYDSGGGYGVVGTFSCQDHTCKSICYKGTNAGQVCSNNTNCPSGTCVHPAVGKEGTSCGENNDCKNYTLDGGGAASGGQLSKPSLCLPDDFGITTREGGLWKCVKSGSDPGGGWKEAGYSEGSEWIEPEEEWYPNAWGDAQHPSYWKHMVPGAVSIWTPSGGGTIWCRYVLETGATLE